MVLCEEQLMFKESAERYVRERYTNERRTALSKTPHGFGREEWTAMSEMGWLAIAYPSALGGLDGSPTDMSILMETVGRGLLLEPFLATSILSARVLEPLVGSTVTAEEFSALLSGWNIMALAFQESGTRYEPEACATQIECRTDRYVIQGRKRFVLSGNAADTFIVTASLKSSKRGSPELALARVSASAPGLTIRPYRLLDGRGAADISMSSVELNPRELLAVGDGASQSMERALDYATAAICAEALGVMTRLFDQTLAYVRSRRQFGAALSSFQAIQHRLADLFAACSEARSLVWMATCALTDCEKTERLRLLSAAKVGVLDRAMFVAREAIQLHGGIGLTEELSVGAGFKRVKALQLMLGDSTFHIARFMTASLREPSTA